MMTNHAPRPDHAGEGRTYTHPDVLRAAAAGADWADPITDPTLIDWAPRQAAAQIWFEVVDGRPVNPHAPTGIRYGRNELGHWGEKAAADALVLATGPDGRRRALLVERSDGHGWAVPGGCLDPEETPLAAAVRELEEETGLDLPGAAWRVTPVRYVPDPRASDEAWMVTVLCIADLGPIETFPAVAGADDAARAEWVLANDYQALVEDLAATYGGRVFGAHVEMLREALQPTEH
ncbi:NUDIX domain-containing protein [Actinomadura viridis]|uniref:NUDIX domain-containing protein n=1 Tax=Actinomadura viridis TaxID=58110 RepID=UPI0036C07C1B